LGASYREATRLLILIVARQAKGGGLKGTVVTIDAIACNGIIAKAVRDAGADYLLALKANQPTLRREIEDLFVQAPAASLERTATETETDKGHGRIEQRTVTLAREVDWLNGTAASPENCACLTLRPSSKSRARLNLRTAAVSRPAITSPRPISLPRLPLRPCATTGVSKISFTGCSMSSSAQISPAYKKAMAPKIWLSSGTSPSTMSASPQTQLSRSDPDCDAKPTPPQKSTSIRLRRKCAAWDPQYLLAVLQTKLS